MTKVVFYYFLAGIVATLALINQANAVIAGAMA
jgi:hypothetical protein